MPMHLHAGERMLMLATLLVNVRTWFSVAVCITVCGSAKVAHGELPPGTCYWSTCKGALAVPDFSGYNCSAGGSATAARTQRMELSWIVHPRIA